jgi:hypothetical protein
MKIAGTGATSPSTPGAQRVLETSLDMSKLTGGFFKHVANEPKTTIGKYVYSSVVGPTSIHSSLRFLLFSL